LLTESGDYVSAETALQDALSMRRRLYGQAHPEIASSLVHVAILQVARHQYDQALLSARAARDMYASAFSPTNWKAALAESISGAALMGLGQYAEADKALIQGSAVLKRDPGVLPMYRNLVQRYLVELHRRWRGSSILTDVARTPAAAPPGIRRRR
jgi:Flp pilus assembly protein TadD